MHGSGAATYGDSVADIYDEQLSTTQHETNLSVAFLAELAHAGGGTCLELGIGTGRVALPLAERGITVHGIDASARMLEKLAEKDGAARIATTLGDFSDLGAVDGTFPLVFVVYSTLFALTSQEAQTRCFAQVARRMRPGGVFVVHAFIPDPARLANRQPLDVRSVELGRLRVNVAKYDAATQLISMAHVIVDDAGTHVYPFPMRYAYPAELDLMAKLAGLRLRERWSSWHKDPFDSSSTMHVSVYEHDAPDAGG